MSFVRRRCLTFLTRNPGFLARETCGSGGSQLARTWRLMVCEITPPNDNDDDKEQDANKEQESKTRKQNKKAQTKSSLQKRNKHLDEGNCLEYRDHGVVVVLVLVLVCCCSFSQYDKNNSNENQQSKEGHHQCH